MQIVVVASNEVSANKYIDRAIVKALNACSPGRVTVATLDDVVAVVSSRRSALLVIGGENAATPLIVRAARRATSSAVWFFEDPYEFAQNQVAAEHFDLVFSNDPVSARRYRNGQFLPLASPLDPDGVAPGSVRPLDFVFVGSGWPERFEPLRQVASVVPLEKRRIIVTENPYIRGLKPWDKIQGRESLPLSFDAVQRLSARSKLTVSLGRSFSGSMDAQQDGRLPGPRLFENAVAGVVQLVSSTSYPASFELFEKDSEIVAYERDQDLPDLIVSLLSDDDRLARIRQRAYDRVLSEHSYQHRAQRIVDLLDRHASERVSEPKPVTSQRVLHVTHNVVANGHFGGAELVLQDLIAVGSANDLVLTHVDRGSWGKEYALLDAHGSVLERIELKGRLDQRALRHAQLEHEFRRVLIENDIHIVNVNHFLGFPPSITRIAKALGCTITFIAHDHFVICDRFSLLNYRDEFCNISSSCESICDICRFRTDGYAPGSMRIRRDAYAAAISNVDRILVGSEDQRVRLQDLFHLTADRVSVSSPPVRPVVVHEQIPFRPDAGESIAFLGNFTKQKGAELILEVADRIRDTEVRFLVFGRVDAEYRSRVARNANIIDCGMYTPGQLPAQLRACRFAVFAPIWPETYCLTLTEAQKAGLVPIVAEIGALPERVEHGVNGLHFAPADAAALEKIISSVVGRSLESLGLVPVVPKSQNADEYAAHLRRLWDEGPTILEVTSPPSGTEGMWATDHDAPLSTWVGEVATQSQRRSAFGSLTPRHLRTLPRRALGVYRRYGLRYAARAAALYVRESVNRS